MDHPLKTLIEAADRAITTADYDRLLEFYAEDAALVVKPGLVAHGKDQIRSAFIAIAAHFDCQLAVRQGKIEVIEGGKTALVLMETFLDVPREEGGIETILRRATYVFRQNEGGRWLCTVDNSYGFDLLAG